MNQVTCLRFSSSSINAVYTHKLVLFLHLENAPCFVHRSTEKAWGVAPLLWVLLSNPQPAVDDDDPVEEVDLVLDAGSGGKSDAQMNGVMVLSLLDKIIGVVDKIQQTQNGLEARQEAMEKSVSTIQGELAKLSKNHVDTANTVNKMLDKVRKVSVNVKTVRSNLEKQAGQIKKLENNEHELLKRRNFKVLIYQVKFACI
ncbi:Caveolae-associated protein 1 [Xenoophorus captivus]|uniref:Caveolae-associated protein 1 n=1 Tax=Xenoophorus captivus TaxID=1517983 RepID=A0ABV0QPT8_9TELE